MAELPPFARFWMVCRKPTGPGAKTEPRQRYSTFEDAMAAARKLANEHDAQFHILETVATARPGDTSQRSLL
ncbi:hypothetical protein [Marinovum algicola]|uniref:hypothetical protein n=1 Tax=Marinovum algicola TaxID=42444 RepID=UPI00352A421F